MKAAGPIVQSGSFISCPTGARFRLVTEPARSDVRGTFVFVHAFAEEMNKSRRMAARMGRLLAGDGWRVVQRDLYGCGDSAGDFGDATWDDWEYDVDDELGRAVDHGPIWLWAERAGALLATSALVARPSTNLLLWQPVTSGTQHLQQFLRLHTGARIVGSAKALDGPSPIERLRSGSTVEVGGYRIRSGLASGLEQASFDLPLTFSGRIAWFEVSTDESMQLSAAAERVVSRLRQRGVAVELEVLPGPPFWTSQEIEDCDSLLRRTRAVVQAASDAEHRPSLTDPDVLKGIAP